MLKTMRALVRLVMLGFVILSLLCSLVLMTIMRKPTSRRKKQGHESLCGLKGPGPGNNAFG
jgi:hypothetical protein